MTLAQLSVLMRVHTRVNTPKGQEGVSDKPTKGLSAFMGLGG